MIICKLPPNPIVTSASEVATQLTQIPLSTSPPSSPPSSSYSRPSYVWDIPRHTYSNIWVRPTNGIHRKIVLLNETIMFQNIKALDSGVPSFQRNPYHGTCFHHLPSIQSKSNMTSWKIPPFTSMTHSHITEGNNSNVPRALSRASRFLRKASSEERMGKPLQLPMCSDAMAVHGRRSEQPGHMGWHGMAWDGMVFPWISMDFHGFSWMCRCSFLGIELSGICDCHLLSRYCKLCRRECRNENKSQICGKICCHCTPANIHLFVQARPTCGGNSLQVGPVLNCWKFLAKLLKSRSCFRTAKLSSKGLRTS